MTLTIAEAKQIHDDIDQIRDRPLAGDLKIKDVVNYKRSWFFGRLWQNIVSLVTCHGLMSTRVASALHDISKDKFTELRTKMLHYAANSRVQLEKMGNDIQARIDASQSVAEVDKARESFSDLKLVGENAERSLEILAYFLKYVPV